MQVCYTFVSVRHVVQAIGNTALSIKINKQIRTIIPRALINVPKERFGFGLLLNPCWPFPKRLSPTTIKPNVSHDTTHTLQWRSIYKARPVSLSMREQKVRILVVGVKIYFHYSREEENAEG